MATLAWRLFLRHAVKRALKERVIDHLVTQMTAYYQQDTSVKTAHTPSGLEVRALVLLDGGLSFLFSQKLLSFIKGITDMFLVIIICDI